MVLGSSIWAGVLVALARRRFSNGDTGAAGGSDDSSPPQVGRHRLEESVVVFLAGPLLALAVGATFSSVWIASLVTGFVVLSVVLALLDLRWKIIPNAIVYPAFILLAGAVVGLWAAGQAVRLVSAVWGFIGYGGGLFLLALLWPGAMGMGDVKLAGLTGLVLGALGLGYVSVAAASAVALGGLAAIILLLTGTGWKAKIPFGPYLAPGAIVSVCWSAPVVDRYLRRPG